MTLGSILTELRLERKLYQKEVADNLKVSVSTLSNYEKDKHYPDPHMLCKIADFYGVTVDYLLGRTRMRYDIDLLCRPLTDALCMSDLVNTSLELTPRHKSSIVEYAQWLKYNETNGLSRR